MKRLIGLTIVSLIALSLSEPASAASMKPGLWAVTSTMDMGAMMPKLTPEQMAMMRRMNMKIPGANGNSFTTQICVTAKDQADAMAYANTARKESGCQPRNVRTMGSSSSADILCTGQMKGQGHANMTYFGDREYKGNFNFKGTSRGRAMDMKTSYHGKFVRADCGTVQPFRRP